jgi:hypothetical protein
VNWAGSPQSEVQAKNTVNTYPSIGGLFNGFG